jgi:general secretion pathway protein F/type IV pilus assembly protein PilC
MLFKYKGIDKNGKNISSKIDALNIKEATAKIKNKQILIINVKKDHSLFDTKSQFNFFKSAHKIQPKDLSNISRDLAIYLQAGISIVNAIKLIGNQYSKNKTIKLFFNTIETFLDEGKNFYQALESQNVIKLPTFYKQSIKVSENSGILDEILLELSKFLKSQDRLSKRLSNAFAYPMFIIVVSMFLIVFMMSVVVPKITGIFEQLHQELPPISQFTINLSHFISNNFILLLAILFISVSTFSALFNLNEKFRYNIDKILLNTPFFGSLIQSSELARFSYMISVLMRSGVSFVQGINLGAKIVNNKVIKQVFEDASNRVVEGSKFSKILLNSNYQIDSSFIQAIALGEETSELPKILQNLSNLYDEDSGDKIDIFLSMLEPFLMLIVGGIIGFIVISMLLPIFSMNIS